MGKSAEPEQVVYYTTSLNTQVEAKGSSLILIIPLIHSGVLFAFPVRGFSVPLPEVRFLTHAPWTPFCY